MSAPKINQSIMALDYGQRRIGVAVGNPITRNAQALTTVIISDPFTISNALLDVIKEWQPHKLVMGMPYNADGSESGMGKSIRRYAALLSDRIDMPIEFIDESYSSREAGKQIKELRQTGKRNRRVKKTDIDKAAAAVMLQRWMDENYT
ncbi:MAG: Holliday junction resolvase RuvX [Gammaproteobacteria bacterium]|nr:Holliday junction resolvase RuvX [Gammaproteobacteria bacterium]NNM13537.1 Holliday junction resolvase RuvX [Gammaproteobacteria bacterium]